MTVNAWSQDSVQPANGQEPVSIAQIHADGSLTLHPALVRQFSPDLLENVFGAQALPGKSQPQHRHMPEPVNDATNHYDVLRKANYSEGRIWASRVRRSMRVERRGRYEAMQTIAEHLGRPVTDIRCLVELHNKAVKPRAKAMRQNLVWQKHLHNMTDRQIADDLRIHSKTVASDRREMKQRQLGGMENVR